MNRVTVMAILGVVIGALVIVLAFSVDAPLYPEPIEGPRSPSPISALPPPPAFPFTPGFPPRASLPAPPPPFGSGAPSPEPSESPAPPDSVNDPVVPLPPVQALPSPPAAELLVLPVVSDADLAIDPNGVSTLAAYREQIATRGSEMAFDGGKLDALPKGAGGFPLLIADLAEAAIRTGSFSGVAESLAVYDELLTAKIAWEKAIPVRADAARANRISIGVDLLTRDLIAKARAVADGTLSRRSFEEYYLTYQATVDFYRSKFQSGNLAYGSPGNRPRAFANLFKLFGLSPEVARAIGVQFGGLITAMFNCSCTGGYTILLTPGYAPAPGTYIFFYNYAFLASPLLFLNHAPFPGHWILGDYIPAPGTCHHDPPDCSPVNSYIGIIDMAGTS